MKVYLSFFGAAIILLCFSCKKQSNGTSPLSGKWQEIKLETYVVDSGKTLYDTTYVASLTSLDYARFTGSDSCILSTDHYYYNTEPGSPKTPQLIPQNFSGYAYNSIGGGKFVLNTTVENVNPGGFVTADTLTQTGTNTLVLHNVFYAHSPGYTSQIVIYFQRQ